VTGITAEPRPFRFRFRKPAPILYASGYCAPVFIGHFAAAFAAKPAVPRTSLATLVAAAQLLDLIWVIGWALLPWIAWFDRHRGTAL